MNQGKDSLRRHLQEKAFNYDPNLEEFYSRLESKIQQPKVVKMRWWKYAAAAAVIAVMVFTGKQLFKEKPAAPIAAVKVDNTVETNPEATS